MSNGIDWFRWHHGSVTDPKFALIARRSGARLGDVLTVWAYVLEKASAADFRSNFGDIDCEAVDCLLGMDDGTAAAIIESGSITGIVFASVDSAQTVHVEHILCTTKSAFRKFRQLVRQVYPGLPLTANHRGRPRRYERI